MRIFACFLLCVLLLMISVPVYADCKVKEVIIYVNDLTLSSDEIRDRCRNRVDVIDCSLAKVIQKVKQGKSESEIYSTCKKK